MHAFEFLKQPGRGGSKPIFAVFGDDAYLRRESIRAISRTALGEGGDEQAVSRFPGDRASVADVLDELRMLPFLAPCRVVVVEDADPFITAHRKDLEAYANKPASTGVLILSAKSWPSNTKLAKLVEAAGLSIDCRAPSESELPNWLVGLARSPHGVKLDADAARLLIELVGPEAALLAGEVEKLATYVGDRKQIGREDVARMVGAGRVETIWKALDAATTGRGTEALEYLDGLLAAGEPPIKLLAGMSFSLRRLHHVGMLRLASVPVAEACKQAGMNHYSAAQAVQKQHAHLGPARVAGIPDLLLRADLDLKGSSMLSPRAVLERLLLWLARPRQEAPPR